MIPGIESLACGPLAVPVEVMEHVARVESSLNPYAIGVVGGHLVRQPRNLAEAVATVRMLESQRRNFSVGLAQVNRSNLARFGLDSPEMAFDKCSNLRAGASILAECLQRFDGRWGDAFSCYYSGDATTGYEHGYVAKVMASLSSGTASDGSTGASSVAAIPLAPADADAARATRNPLSAVARRRVVDAATSRIEPLAQERPFAVVAPPVLPTTKSTLTESVAPGTAHAQLATAVPVGAQPVQPVTYASTAKKSDMHSSEIPQQTTQEKSKTDVEDAARVF